MKEVIATVTKEISNVLSQVREEEAILLSKEMQEAKRIFVYGEGRSGLMGKAFAMRLMHGGYHVFVVGETITPSIEKDDLLVIISGSGKSAGVSHIARKSKEMAARIFLVTTNKDSDLAKSSDGLLVIPAATKHRRNDEPMTIQPLGNQFDQSVHLLLDAIIIFSLSAKEDLNNQMKKLHANLE